MERSTRAPQAAPRGSASRGLCNSWAWENPKRGSGFGCRGSGRLYLTPDTRNPTPDSLLRFNLIRFNHSMNRVAREPHFRVRGFVYLYLNSIVAHFDNFADDSADGLNLIAL